MTPGAPRPFCRCPLSVDAAGRARRDRRFRRHGPAALWLQAHERGGGPRPGQSLPLTCSMDRHRSAVEKQFCAMGSP
jgi:hypothetical protein